MKDSLAPRGTVTTWRARREISHDGNEHSRLSPVSRIWPSLLGPKTVLSVHPERRWRVLTSGTRAFGTSAGRARVERDWAALVANSRFHKSPRSAYEVRGAGVAGYIIRDHQIGLKRDLPRMIVKS